MTATPSIAASSGSSNKALRTAWRETTGSWRFSVVTTSEHEHAHFHCDRCGQLFCLDALTPALRSPSPNGLQHEPRRLIMHRRLPQLQRAPSRHLTAIRCKNLQP